MTLFVLESGLTQASKVTKKFFKKTKLFFVRKNHNETISFISAMYPDDVLTTSSIKDFEQADNGYMKITTQNSVINITPFVVGCFKLYPYLIEGMIGYCPFIKTETFPRSICVGAEEEFTLISSQNISQPQPCDDGQWIEGIDRLFKDKDGYLYLENFYTLSDGTEHISFTKTNVKIG